MNNYSSVVNRINVICIYCILNEALTHSQNQSFVVNPIYIYCITMKTLVNCKVTELLDILIKMYSVKTIILTKNFNSIHESEEINI